MSLLPSNSGTVDNSYTFQDAFKIEEQPSLTYRLNLNTQRIIGKVDGLEAYKQAVYKILNTERYEHLIYSWAHGVELKDLFGQHPAYVIPELERRFREAIMQDDRTESVHSFVFDDSKRGVISVTFTCTSIFGETELQKTVEI